MNPSPNGSAKRTHRLYGSKGGPGILIRYRGRNQPPLQRPKARSLNGENALVRLRTVHLDVDVEIRPAVARDLPAISTWSGPAQSVFAPAIDSKERLLLVALANGRFPVGHVLVDLTGIVSHLLVLAGFRDQGLGTALMSEAEHAVAARGGGHVTLKVEKANTAAIRLYERLGYQRLAESSDSWDDLMPDGSVQLVDHPSWVMRKELGSSALRA